jgi:cytochrome c-type biogenesis protein CcmH/NrfF
MRHVINLARLRVALDGIRLNLLCRTFLVAIELASVALVAVDDASRIQSLTTKVFCNCGCGEILAECSHVECKARIPLKREIASSVLKGRTNANILGDLEKKYGATILVVPSFRGFNRFLWIVPIAGGLIALTVVVWRRWSIASGPRSR